jgi:hypothetical protein
MLGWASRADQPLQVNAEGLLDGDPRRAILRAAQSIVDAAIAAA